MADVFSNFSYQIRNAYEPSAHLWFDECFYPFRGHCSFIQYMPQKPATYGLKFWVMSDSESSIIVNILLYSGKEGGVVQRGLAQRVVMHLSSPYTNQWRNMTSDNYYTFVALAEELWKNKFTALGTLKINSKGTPINAKQISDRTINSSKFYFNGKQTSRCLTPRSKRWSLFYRHNTTTNLLIRLMQNKRTNLTWSHVTIQQKEQLTEMTNPLRTTRFVGALTDEQCEHLISWFTSLHWIFTISFSKCTLKNTWNRNLERRRISGVDCFLKSSQNSWWTLRWPGAMKNSHEMDSVDAKRACGPVSKYVDFQPTVANRPPLQLLQVQEDDAHCVAAERIERSVQRVPSAWSQHAMSMGN